LCERAQSPKSVITIIIALFGYLLWMCSPTAHPLMRWWRGKNDDRTPHAVYFSILNGKRLGLETRSLGFGLPGIHKERSLICMRSRAVPEIRPIETSRMCEIVSNLSLYESRNVWMIFYTTAFKVSGSCADLK
jgi:hypothetical protein